MKFSPRGMDPVLYRTLVVCLSAQLAVAPVVKADGKLNFRARPPAPGSANASPPATPPSSNAPGFAPASIEGFVMTAQPLDEKRQPMDTGTVSVLHKAGGLIELLDLAGKPSGRNARYTYQKTGADTAVVTTYFAGKRQAPRFRLKFYSATVGTAEYWVSQFGLPQAVVFNLQTMSDVQAHGLALVRPAPPPEKMPAASRDLTDEQRQKVDTLGAILLTGIGAALVWNFAFGDYASADASSSNDRTAQQQRQQRFAQQMREQEQQQKRKENREAEARGDTQPHPGEGTHY